MMGQQQLRLCVVVLGLLGSAWANAAEKPEYAVEYRQGIMSAIAWNIGPMGKMVKGDIDFDSKRFAFLAERVAVLVPMALEGFTPDTAAVKSHAKAELWQNQDDLKKRLEELQGATTELAKVAKTGDEAAIRVTFSDTVKMCKSCHDKYQTKH
jgi:cytochrome c556